MLPVHMGRRNSPKELCLSSGKWGLFRAHWSERSVLEPAGRVPLEMIEVQSGACVGEDDIVRFEDAYGRQG